ncbi:T9SS type A sorting domain-containing protein [uncultured Flavobacterium sp.]|uniref:Ig-like domain-containing protein n=1 Tax=uncultured Flavobacterium sp. TaxID=165435 RepID=UPI00259AAEF1|nr:T9SS type A sorting domain-containing protein [uncultured Flavobacterium sp.]
MEWVIKPTLFTQNSTTYLFENRSINTTGTRAVLNTNFNCTMPALTLPSSIGRCGPGTVELSGSLNTTGGSIIWRTAPTGGTILGTGLSITSPAYTANTIVYARGTKDGCTTASQAVNVSINSKPVVNLGHDLDTCLFAAQTIMLNAGPQPAGTNVVWDNNSTNLQRQVDQSGTYYVLVTSANGCKAEDTIKVLMREKPVVNLSKDGNSICLGISKILDAGTGGQNGGSYYWNTGELTQSISVNNPGTYIALVTASNTCSTSDTIEVVANGNAPSITGVQAMAQGGSTFKFTAVNPQYVTSYLWDFGDGSIPSTSPNPMYSYASNGLFNAKLKISSTCADVWDSIQVNIFGVGINDPKADERLLNVYPNPNVDGKLNIETQGEVSIESISMINLSGQEVSRFAIMDKGQTKHSIVLPASLSGGLYHLLIKTDKGMIVKKINLLR